jgi:hypothetical protein
VQEVNPVDRIAGQVQELALGDGDNLQMRFEQREIPRRQRRQEAIASMLVWSHLSRAHGLPDSPRRLVRGRRPIPEFLGCCRGSVVRRFALWAVARHSLLAITRHYTAVTSDLLLQGVRSNQPRTRSERRTLRAGIDLGKSDSGSDESLGLPDEAATLTDL